MPVGRFQVMALLQAARAYSLGLPLESAYSWGLNRAIFYAAAKRGFRGGRGRTTERGTGGPHRPPVANESPAEFHLGDDLAFKDRNSSASRPIFEIGGQRQTTEGFKRQVEARFEGSTFEEAWKDALDYVQHFDKRTLESQSGFYSDVYRPKRDEFAKKWTELGGKSGQAGGTRGRAAKPERTRG